MGKKAIRCVFSLFCEGSRFPDRVLLHWDSRLLMGGGGCCSRHNKTCRGSGRFKFSGNLWQNEFFRHAQRGGRPGQTAPDVRFLPQPSRIRRVPTHSPTLKFMSVSSAIFQRRSRPLFPWIRTQRLHHLPAFAFPKGRIKA